MNHVVNFDEQANCLNCGAKLTTRFCGECGQEKVKRITLKELFKTAQKALLEFESPFLHTFIKMTVQPAVVCKDYIEGKRARYFNPIKYAFWSITFLVFLTAFTDQSLAEHYSFSTSFENQEFVKNMGRVIESSLLFLTFLHCVLYAIMLKLMFRKSGYNFTELYLLALLSFTHVSWFTSLLLILGQMNSQIGQIISATIGIVFPLYAFTTFFTGSKIKAFIKSSCVSLVSLMLMGVLAIFQTNIFLGYEEAELQHKLEQAESEKQVETNNL